MLGLRFHTGSYFAALLIGAVLLAASAVPADAAMTLSKLRFGSASGSENYVYTAGDPIHAEGSVDSGRSFRFVISDPSGAAQSVSACRANTGGTVTNLYTVRSTDPVTTTTAWRYRLEQYTSSVCGGLPEKTDELYFTVARVTAYADAAATMPKSAFADAATVYVQVEGLGKVDTSASVGATSDWQVGFQSPSGQWICTNTGGGDRPDSTASGLLPASSLTPGLGSTLRYQPFTTATGDTWNRQSSYDQATCPQLGAANEGQWRVGLQRDSTHFVVLEAFTVDVTPPDTSITGGPSGITPATTAAFDLGSSEPSVSFECSLDSGAWAPCSSPAAFSGLSDGPHTLSARATDPAGNLDPSPATRNWTVNSAVPAVTLTAPANDSFTSDQTPTLTGAAGTGTGDGPVTVTITEGTGTGGPVVQQLAASGSPTWTTTADPALPEGTYTAWAEQAGSGGTGVSAQHTFTVDTTAPAVALIAPTEGSRTSDPSVPMRGSLGTDPGDDAAPTVEIHAGTTASGSPVQTPAAVVSDGLWTAAPDPLEEGTYTASVRLSDAAGNTSVATHTFAVDLTAPETLISASSGAAVAATDARFELSSPEDDVTFQCRLDGAQWVACPSAPSYESLAEGDHTFEARAIDAAGIVDPTPAQLTWLIDLALPEVAITAPAAGAALSDTTPTVEGTAGTDPGEDDEVEVRIYSVSAPGAPIQTSTAALAANGTWTTTAAPLPDGSYFARAVQRSQAGWGSSAARSFRIDTGPPETSITSGVPGPTTATSATFGFVADEDGASFECRLDGGAWSACASPASYPGLASGSHTFAVRAVDLAGTVDPTPATETWLVDPTLPAVTLSVPAAGALTSDSTPTFAGVAGTNPGDADVVTVRVRSGGALVQTVNATSDPLDGSWSVSAATPLAEGLYTVHAEQTGASGTSHTPARTFTVDTTPPQTTLLAGPTGTTGSTSARLTFSASEPAATFACRLDGGAWEACASPTSYADLAPGDHVFQVRATDAAGNVDPTPPVREWTIAAGVPLTLAAPDDGAVTNDATPAFTGLASTSPDDAPDITVEVYAGAIAVGTPETTLTTTRSAADGGWSVPSSTLPDGTYTAVAKQFDALGENVVLTAAHTFRVDTMAPAPKVTGVDADTAAPVLSGTAGTAAGDAGTLTVTLYEGTAATGTPLQTLAGVAIGTGGVWSVTAATVGDGTYTARAQQTDTAGNSGWSAPATFVVDMMAPETVIDGGPSGSVAADTAQFEFSSEAGATFECRLDAGAWAACESPASYAGLAARDHTFRVRAVDGRGNVDATPAIRTWTVTAVIPPPPPPPDGDDGSSADGQAPAPGPDPVAIQPAADLTAPVLSRISIGKLFTVSKRATAVSAKRRRFPSGTTIRFDLSEAATVQVLLERVLGRGRTVRYTKAGTLTRRSLPAGTNAIRFTGRVGRRALRAGRYRAVLTATDAAGNVSLARRVAFRVARAAR